MVSWRFCESASLRLKKQDVTGGLRWMKLGDLKEPQSADGRSLIIAVDMSCQHQEIFLLVYPKGWAKQRVVGPGDVHIVSRFHRVSTSSGTEKPLAIRLRGTCSLFEGHRQYELVLLNPDGLFCRDNDTQVAVVLRGVHGESVGARVLAAHEYKSSNRPIAEGVLECTQAVQLSPCGFGQLTSEEVDGFATAFDHRPCSGDLVIHMPRVRRLLWGKSLPFPICWLRLFARHLSDAELAQAITTVGLRGITADELEALGSQFPRSLASLAAPLYLCTGPPMHHISHERTPGAPAVTSVAEVLAVMRLTHLSPMKLGMEGGARGGAGGGADDAFRNLHTCPISFDVMHHPVVAADGHTYDRDFIRRWMGNGGNSWRSPMTNKEHLDTTLRPNYALQNYCATYHEDHAAAAPQLLHQ